jgi:hypothetical protein
VFRGFSLNAFQEVQNFCFGAMNLPSLRVGESNFSLFSPKLV